MLDKSITLKFYKQLEIQQALVEHAKNKEIGFRYADSFGKRPDILVYPRDVLELALRGLTSFHASEELWSNPLLLQQNNTKPELDKLRSGWDLVLDIDCAIMEYSRICADLIVKFLTYCGVESVSVKFSGNKGFHIGVPFEAFPKEVSGRATKEMFPEAPKKIAFYVKENIKEELGKRILDYENNDFSQIKKKVQNNEIVRIESNSFGDPVTKLDLDKFLEIDTILISPRHLYRMPYSLHEKSGLVSLPIFTNNILQFEKIMAKPEAVTAPLIPFLDRTVAKETARRLLIQALDFKVDLTMENTTKTDFSKLEINSPIKEDFFPPCMKLILNGLEDGKKRAAFCLSGFLGKIGWSKAEIEPFLLNWNQQKNKNQLREIYIKSQMSSFKPGERLPPNCNNEAYYQSLRVCQPDHLCKRIKNPVNYTLLKWKSWLREKEAQTKEEVKPVSIKNL